MGQHVDDVEAVVLQAGDGVLQEAAWLWRAKRVWEGAEGMGVRKGFKMGRAESAGVGDRKFQLNM